MAALNASGFTVTVSPLLTNVPLHELVMVACGLLMTRVQLVEVTVPGLLSVMFAQ
jgi:hypothetical protein